MGWTLQSPRFMGKSQSRPGSLFTQEELVVFERQWRQLLVERQAQKRAKAEMVGRLKTELADKQRQAEETRTHEEEALRHLECQLNDWRARHKAALEVVSAKEEAVGDLAHCVQGILALTADAQRQVDAAEVATHAAQARAARIQEELKEASEEPLLQENLREEIRVAQEELTLRKSQLDLLVSGSSLDGEDTVLAPVRLRRQKVERVVQEAHARLNIRRIKTDPDPDPVDPDPHLNVEIAEALAHRIRALEGILQRMETKAFGFTMKIMAAEEEVHMAEKRSARARQLLSAVEEEVQSLEVQKRELNEGIAEARKITQACEETKRTLVSKIQETERKTETTGAELQDLQTHLKEIEQQVSDLRETGVVNLVLRKRRSVRFNLRQNTYSSTDIMDSMLLRRSPAAALTRPTSAPPSPREGDAIVL